MVRLWADVWELPLEARLSSSGLNNPGFFAGFSAVVATVSFAVLAFAVEVFAASADAVVEAVLSDALSVEAVLVEVLSVSVDATWVEVFSVAVADAGFAAVVAFAVPDDKALAVADAGLAVPVTAAEASREAPWVAEVLRATAASAVSAALLVAAGEPFALRFSIGTGTSTTTGSLLSSFFWHAAVPTQTMTKATKRDSVPTEAAIKRILSEV